MNQPRLVVTVEPEDVLYRRLHVSAVAAVVDLGFSVVHDPLPGDPAHALVIGENSKQMARALASSTIILILPGSAER